VYNEVRHNLHFSRHIIRRIGLKRMRLFGLIALMVKMKKPYRFLVLNSEVKNDTSSNTKVWKRG
jgi:hypothetical protein